jgi:putative acetyltransferase
LNLRPATNGDGEAARELVFAVLREHGLEPDPEGTDADFGDLEGAYLAQGGTFDVLVDENGTIVGTIALLPVDETTVELRKMYLAPSMRGRGLGRRLLDHALARARALGFHRVTLETHTVLKTATALYQAYGFTPYNACHVSKRCNATLALDLV